MSFYDTPREVDWFSLISVLGLLCFAPFIVFYFVMACDQYRCSLSQPLLELLRGDAGLLSIWERTASFSWSAAKIYSAWVAFQVRLRRGRGANERASQLVCPPRCSCTCLFLTSLIR